MIFTFFMTIVFIAEIIIAVSAIIYLIRFDKKIISANEFVISANPKIKDICTLMRGLSEQLIEIIPDFIDKIKLKAEDFLIDKIRKLLMGLIIWNINIKIIKKIRKSGIFKLVWKGFTLVKNML